MTGASERLAERLDDAGASRRPALSDAWILLAITAVGTVLRLYHLGAQPLWMDEVSSLRNAYAFGAQGLAGAAEADQVAPLHTVILWLAMQLGGNSEVALRLPSALAGIALMPVMHVVAMRMFGSRTVAAIASGLVAISPFAIWYSQEARMYAFFLLAGTAYVAIAWPASYRSLNRIELLSLCLVTVIGLGAHHYMALLCIAFGFFLILKGDAFKARSWGWLATQVLAALIFSGWLFLTLHKLGGMAGSEKPAAAFWIPYTFYAFVVGFSFGPPPRALADAGSNALQLVADHAWSIGLCAIATLGIALLALRTLVRPENRNAAFWLAMWLAFPLALSLFATLVTQIEFNVRYVTASYAAMILLLALGIAELLKLILAERAGVVSDRPLQLAGSASLLILAGCFATSLANHFANPIYAKEDVRSLARVLESASPETILVTDNSRVVKVLRYYGGRTPVRDLQVDRRDICGRLPHQVWAYLDASRGPQSSEVWLIEYRSWESDRDHLVRSQMDQHAGLISQQDLEGVSIRRYRPSGDAMVPASLSSLSARQSAPISQANWTMLGFGLCD